MKLREIEKAAILNAFKRNGENTTKTARELGIGLRTMQRKLRSYGVSPKPICRAVLFEGRHYESISAAARAEGLSVVKIRPLLTLV